MGIDLFIGSIAPRRYVADGDRAAEGVAFVAIEGADPPETALRTGPFGHVLMAGLHQTVATLAAMGHNLVVDHVFWERRWLDEWRPNHREDPHGQVQRHGPSARPWGRARCGRGSSRL